MTNTLSMPFSAHNLLQQGRRIPEVLFPDMEELQGLLLLRRIPDTFLPVHQLVNRGIEKLVFQPGIHGKNKTFEHELLPVNQLL
jgi:hypothetical protein